MSENHGAFPTFNLLSKHKCFLKDYAMKNLVLYMVVVLVMTSVCLLFNGVSNREYLLGGFIGFGSFWGLLLLPILHKDV